MDDFISREKAIEAIWKPKVTPNASIFDALRKCCEEEVKYLPAADVVEVVRCKDCVYYNITGCANGYGWCEDPLVSKGVCDYWFCANGKRRMDNGN